MGSLFRSLLPIRSSKKNDGDDDQYNVEYSFATEYTGPPVSYYIPKALPVDVGCISTASVVSTPSNSGNLSLPVIYPVVKRETKLFSSELKESGFGLGVNGVDADEPSLLEKEGSSVSLEFSDSQENSKEFSVSSDADDLDKDFHEIEEVLSSAREEDRTQDEEEVSGYDNRTQIVTFREPESRTMVQEESDYSVPGMMIQERPHANPHVKKGLCHRCLKGNRFTIKEVCIVCDAKYCSNCVLRVMGAMPEGRKCISCIGYPIDESKRVHLGKSSKVLKNLLTDYEVKQVMRFEKSCQVNQAPYWLVIVNGKGLSIEEVVQLQTCAYPPKRLVPGSYWYDKLSGFWGEVRLQSLFFCLQKDSSMIINLSVCLCALKIWMC